MGELGDLFSWRPVERLTLREVKQRYPHLDTERMGVYEGVRWYPEGESPEVNALRHALEPVRDESGRLVGLRPKGYRPSNLEVMRSVDLMMEMTR